MMTKRDALTLTRIMETLKDTYIKDNSEAKPEDIILLCQRIVLRSVLDEEEIDEIKPLG